MILAFGCQAVFTSEGPGYKIRIRPDQVFAGSHAGEYFHVHMVPTRPVQGCGTDEKNLPIA